MAEIAPELVQFDTAYKAWRTLAYTHDGNTLPDHSIGRVHDEPNAELIAARRAPYSAYLIAYKGLSAQDAEVMVALEREPAEGEIREAYATVGPELARHHNARLSNSATAGDSAGSPAGHR
jgi:hypothetical protein